uniref:Bacterial bifunctional deaminase-reductase C-terminal domain-containing protein n=1 Tax=Chromera velia CCMP2878 TaxID=1169474 RepID=A0A0G4HTW8_9ALVE|eukprot:Cvel_8543.t1-p1 / transcript=Cvel_8543.t1 / gene=Cvel_8543 / organism=Chromera_velia_CCMP2878 / gene_product=hypothetical protein / transcript_product=hypothetical protein / location=Cvel_scaffold473:79416-84870(+) / protein_length=425 / sequence_SO=supercontig / SO=protein_coding / is_pseudo=false
MARIVDPAIFVQRFYGGLSQIRPRRASAELVHYAAVMRNSEDQLFSIRIGHEGAPRSEVDWLHLNCLRAACTAVLTTGANLRSEPGLRFVTPEFCGFREFFRTSRDWDGGSSAEAPLDVFILTGGRDTNVLSHPVLASEAVSKKAGDGSSVRFSLIVPVNTAASMRSAMTKAQRERVRLMVPAWKEGGICREVTLSEYSTGEGHEGETERKRANHPETSTGFGGGERAKIGGDKPFLRWPVLTTGSAVNSILRMVTSPSSSPSSPSEQQQSEAREEGEPSSCQHECSTSYATAGGDSSRSSSSSSSSSNGKSSSTVGEKVNSLRRGGGLVGLEAGPSVASPLIEEGRVDLLFLSVVSGSIPPDVWGGHLMSQEKLRRQFHCWRSVVDGHWTFLSCRHRQVEETNVAPSGDGSAERGRSTVLDKTL